MTAKILNLLLLGILFTGFLTTASVKTNAQTPTPEPSMTPQASPTPIIPGQTNTVTLSAFLEEVVQNFVVFKNAFINTIENGWGGYFSLLAYILAWIIAVYYFSQQFLQGEWDMGEIGRYTGRLSVCLLLLIFCGDVDGDGRRGDLIRFPGYIGYHFAFGGDDPSGNYLSRSVNEESTKFKNNYDAFVQNKLMVKINGRDMPVRYPGIQGVQTVAAVYTGQAKPEQEKEVLNQEFWIGLLFQLLNICRSIIAIVDFFLLALYSFSILVMILVAPFMVCALTNRELAKRFTYPFLWSVFTITIIFPAVSQAARYFAYLSGNLAIGTSGNPVYTFDPTTYTIVANGDPTPMILVAVLFMLISILILAMSVVLSYSLMQGKLIESMSGLIANAFSSLSTVGLNAAVSGMAMKIQSEGERQQINENFRATQVGQEYSLAGQQVLANSGYTASMIKAGAQKDASEVSALGQLMGGTANVQAQQFASVNDALSQYRYNARNLSSDEKREYAGNLIEMMKGNNDASIQNLGKQLEMYPDKLDLLAKVYDSHMKGIPIGGAVLNQLGINEESLNTWMRTEGFKGIGGWLFGDPSTGTGGVLQKMIRPGSSLEQTFGNLQSVLKSNPNGLVFQRGDGSFVDAMTGQRLSSNIVDLTGDGSNYSTTSVGGIYSGGGGGGGGRIFGVGNSFRPRSGVTDNRVARILNDEMIKMGYSPNARLSVLGDIGRENSWNWDTIFNGHIDPASFKNGRGEIRNIGIISWNGDRRDALMNQLNREGFVKNGQVVKSEGALRSMMRFMDTEMKTGKWGRQWSSMRNPNLSTQQISDGMQRYILYSESPVYNTMEQGFNVMANRKWAEKAYGLVSATGGGGITRSNSNVVTTGNLNRSNSNVVTTGNLTRNPTTYVMGGGNMMRPQVFGGGGGGRTQMPVQSNSTFANTNPMFSQMNDADAPTARLMGKMFSNDAILQNTQANNALVYNAKNQATQQYFNEKQQSEQLYTQDRINNANQTAQIQMGGLQAVYDSQIQSAGIVYQGESQSAQVIRDGSLTSAQLNYEGQMKAAEINKTASLDALYKRNMGQLIQSVGGSVSHQISELFERASRGM